MKNLQIDISKVFSFVSAEEVESYQALSIEANKVLDSKTGKGNEFLGWVNLPTEITKEELEDINQTAKTLQGKAEILVVIGIGGSYLGAKAVIEALSHSFSHLKKSNAPIVLFAGQNIGEDYMQELREVLKDKEYALIVISKSGTTTEPAIAFRILKKDIEEKYGKKEAAQRIVAVTDASKGALRKLAEQEGYKTYVISDDIGGRYSVLTPVGLLPIAVAGYDICKMVEGAQAMEKITAAEANAAENPAITYSAARNALYNKGKQTEILVNYQPKLHFVAEWWKQLYGESEGKENKGIFPASVDFTSDLHSMGQYIQEGLRNIFETVLSVENSNHELTIPFDNDNLDSLNYIAGKRIDYVNKMAELGTMLAHVDGGVPNIKIVIPQISEYYIGQLLYFFEKACGISGYVLNVNPFDQPGVEAYKSNMFALLGKPGFEEATKQILKKIE